MKVSRGDVVILDHPFSSGAGSKVRPVLVVQSDPRNSRLTNTIVAMITRNVQRIGTDDTQLLINIATPDGRLSGLRATSAVTCGSLFTVQKSLIRKKIGRLSDSMMRQIDGCLKRALDLP